MQRTSEQYDLAQWLEHLEQIHTQEIQLGLDRIRTVGQKMGLLHPHCPVITVAGTNGKGSTVAALEALYHTAGYKIGTYTSPHLHVFNERIRINQQNISDADLCKAFLAVEEHQGDIPLTYFEVATLSALWYFNNHSLDIIVLEVGLGGRLDAVNVIDPAISIITTIDFDHQEWLGDTLDAIGYEKAGIMRQGKPCIYADFDPPESILEAAREKAVKLYRPQEGYRILEGEKTWTLEYRTRILELPKPPIQVKSAAAALLATLLLEDTLPMDLQKAAPAMQNIFVPGRLEWVPGEISLLYDVSHNPQGVRLLLERIKTLAHTGKIHAVFSALQDKDINGLLTPLKHQVHHWYPAQLENKRAASREVLTAAFEAVTRKSVPVHANPLQAFEAAGKQAEPGDLIIVYGSFYTVAAIRGHHNTRRCNENCS